MSTLALTYCNFCELVKSFFKTTKKAINPSYDKKVYSDLQRLTDYELRDIGLCRGDIMHIAKGGTVYRGGA